MPNYEYNIEDLNDILGDYGLSGNRAFEVDALNAWVVNLGGDGGHTYSIDALNEVILLIGGSGTYLYEIDALNEISRVLGGASNFQYVEDVLNEISGLPVFGGGGGDPYTWDPLNQAFIDLSNGNLTATPSAAGSFVRGAGGQTSGKYYCEFIIDRDPLETTDGAFGIVNYNFPITDTSGNYYLGNAGFTSLGFWVWDTDGYWYINEISTAIAPYFDSGDVISMAVDLDAEIAKYRVNGGAWSVDVDISAVIANNPTIFPAVNPSDSEPSLWTANFGATAYAHSPPVGYLNWDGSDAGGVDAGFTADSIIITADSTLITADAT